MQANSAALDGGTDCLFVDQVRLFRIRFLPARLPVAKQTHPNPGAAPASKTTSLFSMTYIDAGSLPVSKGSSGTAVLRTRESEEKSYFFLAAGAWGSNISGFNSSL